MLASVLFERGVLGNRPLRLIGPACALMLSACSEGRPGGKSDSAVWPHTASPADTSGVRQTASETSSIVLPSAAESSWLTFRGDGFTLRYPPDAIIDSARSHPGDVPGLEIRGPRIHLPVDPNRGPSDGPAYRLWVASFPNLASVTTEVWVDSVRRKANDHPMDADSLGYLAAPDTVTFGAVRALRLQPFCGDCSPEELYLAAPHRLVLLSYVFDVSIPGDRDAQQRLYAAIISTFQWHP